MCGSDFLGGFNALYRGSDPKLKSDAPMDPTLQVFDTSSRSLLRQLRAHRRPVHAVSFGSDKLHLLSGGDDAAVRLWDITSGVQLCQLQGHSDYVRAAAASPTSADVWATGGYARSKDQERRRKSAAVSVNPPLPSPALLHHSPAACAGTTTCASCGTCGNNVRWPR